MPARKLQGLAALLQIHAERDALDKRARAARTEAATELGEAVLDAVGPAFAPREVAELLRVAQRLGFTEAMRLLGGTPLARQPGNESDRIAAGRRANGAPNGSGNGVDHVAH